MKTSSWLKPPQTLKFHVRYMVHELMVVDLVRKAKNMYEITSKVVINSLRIKNQPSQNKTVRWTPTVPTKKTVALFYVKGWYHFGGPSLISQSTGGGGGLRRLPSSRIL